MARTEGVIFWPLPRFSFPSAHTKSSTRDRFPWWLRKGKKKKNPKNLFTRVPRIEEPAQERDAVLEGLCSGVELGLLSPGFLLLHRPLSSPFACGDTVGSSLLFAPRGANIHIQPFSCKIQSIPGLPVPAGSPHTFLRRYASLPWPLMVADGAVPDFHFHNALLRVPTSWVEDGIAPPFRGSHFIDATAWLSLCPQNPEAGGSGHRDGQSGWSRCYSQFGQLEINIIPALF